MMRGIIVVGLWLGACDEGPTSLQGEVACGAKTCTTGQLCRLQATGVDGGAGIPPACVLVLGSCHVFDCQGTNCSTCVLDICADASNVSLRSAVRLSGRELFCPGQ